MMTLIIASAAAMTSLPIKKMRTLSPIASVASCSELTAGALQPQRRP